MSRQELHDAILEALLSGGLLSQETIEKLLGDPADADATSKIEQLIDEIVEQMQQQGYITGGPDFDAERERREGQRRRRPDGPPAKFEVTDKSIDFLGYRALRDLLGSLGKSSAGRHDTRDLSTGIEAEAAPKPYEFGDTMNLDASATLLHAVQRDRAAAERRRRLRRRLRRPDGQPGRVPELVRDGADARLQPQHDPLRRGSLHAGQARGARARPPDPHQYPGDALHCVLFHDSAEEVPLQPAGAACGSARTTPTRAKACGWRGASSSGSARTCGRSS